MQQRANEARKIPSVALDEVEILAPVGDEAMLEAALGAGADAIYLGSGPFHARSQTVSFALEHLQETVQKVHRQGVKLYMTLNTLVFEKEWEQAASVIRCAYEAGVDALIVQDLGLCEAVHRLCPYFPLHASTQMALHNRQALDSAQKLGISRIVLPRELSLEEIRSQTAYARTLGMETEVFVQGALCVCYSGHCQMSYGIGGRSANRGSCAQPCRHKYKLIGRDQQGKALLSPKDISYLDYVPELREAGVASFKIEGRMRSPEYVAKTVELYQKALRQESITQDQREELLQVFNRGGSFSAHRLLRQRGRHFLSGQRSGNQGIYLGKSEESERSGAWISFVLEGPCPLKGDTLVLRNLEGEDLASAPIGQIEIQGKYCRIRGFHPEKIRSLPAAIQIYRARSLKLQQETARLKRKKGSLNWILQGGTERIRLTLEAPDLEKTLSLEEPCDLVKELQEERVEQQLQKIGSSGFAQALVRQNGPVHLKIAHLNEMRRNLLERYLEQRAKRMDFRLQAQALPENFEELWKQVPETKNISCVQINQKINTFEKWIHLPGWRKGDSLPDFIVESKDSSIRGLGKVAYLLPLVELLRLEKKEYQSLFQCAPILVSVPAGAPLHFYEEGSARYPQWRAAGLLGEAGSGLTTLAHKFGDSEEEKKNKGLWILFPDANIANFASQHLYHSWGANAWAYASELTWEEQQELSQAFVRNTRVEKNFSLSSCVQFLLPSGAKEAMLFEHCPIGFGEENCKACQDKRLFELEDRMQARLPYLPLPHQSCSGRLYNPREFSYPFLKLPTREWGVLETRLPE